MTRDELAYANDSISHELRHARRLQANGMAISTFACNATQ